VEITAVSSPIIYIPLISWHVVPKIFREPFQEKRAMCPIHFQLQLN
jgi:hypothetical protein